jgi:hypothetical protein
MFPYAASATPIAGAQPPIAASSKGDRVAITLLACLALLTSLLFPLVYAFGALSNGLWWWVNSNPDSQIIIWLILTIAMLPALCAVLCAHVAFSVIRHLPKSAIPHDLLGRKIILAISLILGYLSIIFSLAEAVVFIRS